mmetsp:Transcript_18931/g.20881  ORF Transcript_18931/g.20881 Transcript_18931/m.20881 type:complete len:470 (+) Transcript_18931:132-1541(+)
MNMNTNNDAICYDLQKLSSEGEQLLVMDNNRTQSRDINDGSGGNCTENGRIDKVMSDDHHASLNVNVNPSPQQQQQQKGGIISDESSHGDNCDEETNNSAITSTAEGEREEQGDGNVQTIPGRLIESMTEIVKSPYESNCCAEVNEDCFEQLKVLMEPIPGCGDSSSVDPDDDDPIDRDRMINLQVARDRLFGVVLARILYQAYSEIQQSGILFIPIWREGKIRNTNLSWIPKRQLLICLPPDRFAEANGSVLQAVIRNLDCFELIIETMESYFGYDYLNLLSNKKTFVFDDPQKPRCFKCLIFVARGYAIMKNLGIAHAISSSLKKKFRACLHILNKHVQPNKPELARLKKEIETEARPKTATIVTPENKKRVAYNDTSSGSEANRTTTSNKKIRRQCNKEPPSESLLVSFNIIRGQMQRVNQMANHLNNHFHGHRDGLMEAITDTIMNENANAVTGVDSDSSDTKKP